MNGRDLERTLVALGAGQSSVDVVMRRLRGAKRLPSGGRGFNAPQLSAAEIAVTLVAIAGSAAASDADERLSELEQLQSTDPLASHDSFVEALTKLLETPSATGQLVEVRVGKNVNRAEICYRDHTLRFGRTTDALGAAMYRAEGVLPAALLHHVARVLAGETAPPKHRYWRIRS